MAQRPPRFWYSLSAVERSALDATGVRWTFRAGATVLAPHDRTGDVVLVQTGFVTVVGDVGGERPVVLAVRGPGDILGELGHVGTGPRAGTVVAVGEVEALRVPCEAFTRFLRRYANASDVLRCTLVDRLREADRARIAAEPPARWRHHTPGRGRTAAAAIHAGRAAPPP